MLSTPWHNICIFLLPSFPFPVWTLWSLSQDDIIDDVEDYVAAAEILKERGAYKIYIMATHGLLSAEAPRLIEESAIDEVKSCADGKIICVTLSCWS